jgi:hypothetical protein
VSTTRALRITAKLKGPDLVEVKVWDERARPGEYLINQVIPRAQLEAIYEGLGKLLWPKTVES